jgi:TIR domain-containing protein
MPSIFLSHSTKDKSLARQIANDLLSADISVWLGEWEILVGDSITQRIQQGLEEVDYVAVLLTKHSVESGWVEKEWQTKIGVEAES